MDELAKKILKGVWKFFRQLFKKFSGGASYVTRESIGSFARAMLDINIDFEDLISLSKREYWALINTFLTKAQLH